MKISKNYLFFMLALAICLQLSAAPRTLSFEDLSLDISEKHSLLLTLQGQTVQIRGFWYTLSPEEGILAPQPNLKSCCLKVPGKVQQQLIVKGEKLSLLPAQRALTLEGIFKIEPVYDFQGHLAQAFILEQAKEVPQPNFHLSLILLLAIFIFLFSIGWRFLRACL